MSDATNICSVAGRTGDAIVFLILYYGEDKSDALLPACERKKRGKRGRNNPVRGKTADGLGSDFVVVVPSRLSPHAPIVYMLPFPLQHRAIII